MCVRISHDLFYFPVNGNFGTSMGPFVFDSLARPLHDCIRKAFILSQERTMPPFVETDAKGDVIVSSFPSTHSYMLPGGTSMGVVHRLTDDFIETTRADLSHDAHRIVQVLS